MSTDDGCVFCRIVTGEIPATIVGRNEHAVAFPDINPQAPTHVLVVPVQHHPDVPALAAADPPALAALTLLAAQVAGGAFRFVFNTGAEAGQTVFHVHGHVLADRPFAWPPG